MKIIKRYNVVVIGTGYVGLVTGVGLASLGHTVTCVDTNKEKISVLNMGISPIYEDGLEDKMHECTTSEHLFFTTDLSKCINNADIVFTAVGTPMVNGGEADLSYVFETARSFGNLVNDDKIFVIKSTVPVGTAEAVKKIIYDIMDKRGVAYDVAVVSNPEFLKEGNAMADFETPDRIVIGCDDTDVIADMRTLYHDLITTDDTFFVTDNKSAEIIKYASNAMLATRISFINEIANLCDKVGADVESVAKGMGMDKRIGPKFLKAGCGYGGSCFPKDVNALIKTAKKYDVDMKVINAVDAANVYQKTIPLKKVKELLGDDLTGKKICVLGLAFKPGTDDAREAPAADVIRGLFGMGATVMAYDPMGSESFRHFNSDIVRIYTDSMEDAISNSDAVIIMTEWQCFKDIDWDKMKDVMRGDVIVDCRNIYYGCKDKFSELGLRYTGIGIR